MPTPPLRAALLGYGLGGEVFHAPFLATTPGLQLASIVTTDPGRRARAAQRYPDARLLGSASEGWADAGEHDLVVVTTTNDSHVPLALDALHAGLAVVVDKPLAPSAAAARALLAAGRETGQLLTVFQNRRWDADFLTLREVLGQGQLGEVLRFESRFERWRPQPDLEAWRERADADSAGGLLFDLGSHLIDQAVVLFGPPTHVYAEVDLRRPGVAVDDDTFVALTHAGGQRSHLWMSATAAHLGPRLRVLGTKGAYVAEHLDAQEAQLFAGMAPTDPACGVEPPERWPHLVVGRQSAPVPAVPGCYRAFYEGVVAALRDGAPPPVDPADAVVTLDVIEAAFTSARSGRVVAL